MIVVSIALGVAADRFAVAVDDADQVGFISRGGAEAYPHVGVLGDDAEEHLLAVPPIMIGGCGFCTGFGRPIASVTV